MTLNYQPSCFCGIQDTTYPLHVVLGTGPKALRLSHKRCTELQTTKLVLKWGERWETTPLSSEHRAASQTCLGSLPSSSWWGHIQPTSFFPQLSVTQKKNGVMARLALHSSMKSDSNCHSAGKNILLKNTGKKKKKQTKPLAVRLIWCRTLLTSPQFLKKNYRNARWNLTLYLLHRAKNEIKKGLHK